jgi:hypothetical protein
MNTFVPALTERPVLMPGQPTIAGFVFDPQTAQLIWHCIDQEVGASALSAKWHEAVASHMSGPNLAFPPPWYPAAKIGDYDIVPIDDSAALYLEGAAMRHCVGTYADHVQSGRLYVYSVRRASERVATFPLAREAASAMLSEIRGPCNAQPDKQIVAAVRRWLRAQAPLPRSEFKNDVWDIRCSAEAAE